MKLPLEIKILIFFTIILSVIILLSWGAKNNTRHYKNTLYWVEHTQEVLILSEKVSSLVEEIENSMGGYTISGDSSFLSTYQTSSENIFFILSKLQSLTEDNPIQQKRIDSLKIFVRNEIVFLNQILALRTAKGLVTAQNLIAGHKYMHDMQNIIDGFQSEENRLLYIRKAANEKNISDFNKTYNLQLTAVMIAFIIAFFTVRDILIKRKKAEKLLLENHQLLQAIIDNTSSFIYVKDLQGKYILVNKAYSKMSGSNKNDIIGKTAFDFADYESALQLKQQDEEVVKENKIFESEQRVVVVGEAHDFFSVRFPLLNVDGQIYATGGVFTDITEIKKQNHLIKDLYDNAPSGYYSVDSNGKFINANNITLKWLGYEKNELIAKSLADILAPENMNAFTELFPVFKEKGYETDLELFYKRKDGSTFPVLINSSAVKNEFGDFLYSRSTILDITERKKLEENLNTINNELESFTYSVSHDLRAPLRIINGYAQIIKEDATDTLSEEGKRMLQNIILNARRMGNLIDDLLNFSRLGRRELVTHDTDMNAIVQPILALQLNGNVHYNVKLHNLPQCNCDSSLIKQVWENLISNSVKYSANKPNPAIEIGSVRENSNTVYYIKDNGAGFDMKYYHKLFGVFQRLHKTSEFEGTGVGLALTQRIISKHGGKIWAQSKINEGSTFYFTICKT